MDASQEPRWLDAEERQAWLALASALNRLPIALDAQLRRDAGISHFEYQVLALLSEAPGRTLRMSALATLAEGSLPRLSQVVARLEQRGWVRRTPAPADGRVVRLIGSGSGISTRGLERLFRSMIPVGVGPQRKATTVKMTSTDM